LGLWLQHSPEEWAKEEEKSFSSLFIGIVAATSMGGDSILRMDVSVPYSLGLWLQHEAKNG